MSATLVVPQAAEDGAGGRQFVTFHVFGEVFGVPLGGVQEIIRMPEVVQVPLSPPTLEGIANLRGAVLPITSLRRVFGSSDALHDDATRVVVVNRAGSPVGFVVDRMASVITAEDEEIEDASEIEATIKSDMLQGVVKRTGGMIMLLDPDRLVNIDQGALGGGRRRSLDAASGAALAPESGEQAAAVDELQLVNFEAAGQEYAFPIEDVQEIVQVPGHVTQVPQTRSQVVGVMSLRERLLPLVSLRRMFALPETPVDEQSRIVVVSSGGPNAASIGIVMDRVKEVLRVNRALVDAVPPLLQSSVNGENEFDAICRLDSGRRLVTILSARRMFRDTALREALSVATDPDGFGKAGMAHAINNGGPGVQTSDSDDEEQFVVFKLAGEEYGVPIADVQEIVRVPEELTHVPKVNAFMEGIVNLRGMVLPVVDQRRRFALPDAERNDRQRIMVLMIKGVRTGFIVDQVSEVLKIPQAVIEAAPALSDKQARLIRRVANLGRQKRMILLLDAANLLDAGEIAAIDLL